MRGPITQILDRIRMPLLSFNNISFIKPYFPALLPYCGCGNWPSMRRYRFLMVVFALSLLSCSPKKFAVKTTAEILDSGTPALETEIDVEVAREASLIALKQMEAFRYSHPKNKKLNILLSRSYSSYAFGFLEEDILKNKEGAKERAKLFYARGRDYGFSAMPDIDPKSDFPNFRKNIQKLKKKNLASIFWTAFNWGGLIRLDPDAPQNLMDLPKVEAMMEKILELDPNYYFGSALAFAGSIQGMRPPMLGGSSKKSKEYFEKAIAVSKGKFLMHYVVYAQFYADHWDPELKKELLQKVLEAPEDLFPEQALANQIAKRRAKILF